MLSALGIVIVIVAVFGGYWLENGDLRLLMQPAEFVIIWGAALGSLIVATPLPVIRRVFSGMGKVFRADPYNKAFYLATLKLLFQLFHKGRMQGLVALDTHVERPRQSDIFRAHKTVLANHSAVGFICDTLRFAVTGGVPAGDIDQMVETDLEVQAEHNRQPVHSLTTIADALPGLGIVAAVMGIVITMGSLGGPPEELGAKVAAALVGTFLGVLTCYGFVSPLAEAMNAADESEGAYLRALKEGLIAFIKGHPPVVAMEFTRRAVPHDVRPTFSEMERRCLK